MEPRSPGFPAKGLCSAGLSRAFPRVSVTSSSPEVLQNSNEHIDLMERYTCCCVAVEKEEEMEPWWNSSAMWKELCLGWTEGEDRRLDVGRGGTAERCVSASPTCVCPMAYWVTSAELDS